MDVSTRFFWAASYGQIYPELARLEERGLVRGDDRSNGRRRRTYELTCAGERALHDWLTSREPLHVELRHIRAAHEAIAEQLRAIEPAEPEGKPRRR